MFPAVHGYRQSCEVRPLFQYVISSLDLRKLADWLFNLLLTKKKINVKALGVLSLVGKGWCDSVVVGAYGNCFSHSRQTNRAGAVHPHRPSPTTHLNVMTLHSLKTAPLFREQGFKHMSQRKTDQIQTITI